MVVQFRPLNGLGKDICLGSTCYNEATRFNDRPGLYNALSVPAVHEVHSFWRWAPSSEESNGWNVRAFEVTVVRTTNRGSIFAGTKLERQL